MDGCQRLWLLIGGVRPHHVSRSHAKVDGDGCDGEEAAHAVVFMDPAADLLQEKWRMLKLLSQRHHQQQQITQQHQAELDHDGI